MHLLRRFIQGGLHLGSIAAFSDGIFALLKADQMAWEDVRGVVQGLVGPLCYLVGAAAAWVYIRAAFVIYTLTPRFHITPPQGPGGAKNGQ
jgi:hypothetical protein